MISAERNSHAFFFQFIISLDLCASVSVFVFCLASTATRELQANALWRKKFLCNILKLI